MSRNHLNYKKSNSFLMQKQVKSVSKVPNKLLFSEYCEKSIDVMFILKGILKQRY